MSFAEGSPPVVRHFLTSEAIHYIVASGRPRYTIDGIVSVLRPPTGQTYPAVQAELWVFGQLQGNPGMYEVWIDLVRTDEETDTEEEITTYGPWQLMVRPDLFAVNRAWKLLNVPFPSPGLYEFRLRCGPDTLAVESILLEESP